MTAAAAARVTPERASKPFAATKSIPVKTATTIWQGTMVAIDATGYAVPAATDTDHRIQGVATETVVNAGASGAKYVKVAIGTFMMNNSAAADAIAVTERGSECYIVDDNTVAKTDGTGTRSRAGKIEEVESAGVWVSIHPYGMPNGTATLTGAETLTNKTLTEPTIADMTNAPHDHADAAGGGLVDEGAIDPGTAYQLLRTNAGATASEWGAPMGGPVAALPDHVANDIIPPTITSGAIYTIPALDAGSTITLPAAATSGTYCWIIGDGTLNDQAVTVRDATGPTNLTTALSASKRLCIFCVKVGTAWYANAYVGP